MTLQGDLATLELPDILQNLEMHRKSGTLAIETEKGLRRVYVHEGAITLFAGDGRPSLMDDLVTAGLLEEKQLASARRPRWRRRRALCEVLVKRGVFDTETLTAFAHARLVEDVCDFLALETGSFRFHAGRPPAGVFDPEERHLGLSLAAAPVLFESARRKDHMAALRTRIGSDATHYVADGEPTGDGLGDDLELAAALCDRLDGTRSVREALRAFPDRRFAARELLATLASFELVRPTEPEDLVRLAREVAHADPERALRVLRDGLETTPRHVGLLRDLADLCERLGDGVAAAEALKLLAHLRLEEQDKEGAREDLGRACALAPKDTTIHERRMELARVDGRTEEAIEHGRVLVELYRGPGLHAKAATVLETLVTLAPDAWDLRRELARTRADCGNPTLAVAELRRYGKQLLARREDRAAREVQEEILTLVPKDANAKHTIELIDSEAFERRRKRRRSFASRALGAAIAVPVGLLLVFDVAARLAFLRAARISSELELIERRRYADAIELYEDVRASYPWTLTSRVTATGQVELLEEKLGQSGPAAGR